MTKPDEQLCSPEHRAYLAQLRKRRRQVLFCRLAILILFLALWEIAAAHNWINAFISSQPTKVWQTFRHLLADQSLWRHLAATTQETLIGFLAGSGFGVLIAVLLWWSPFLARICEPYLVILNSLPKVALGPLFIVWLGTGQTAIVAVALMTSLIVTVLQIHASFQEIDPHYVTLAISFGASKMQVLRHIIVQASLPAIISALKVNVGLSMVGVIVGEFLVAKEGLGYLIIYGGQVFNLNLVMTGIVVLLLLAACLYGAVVLMERFLLRNR